MSLKAGTVPPMPDLACVGIVKKVEPAYPSDKGVYHVLPIQLNAVGGGRDGLFFFLFQPRWFAKDFDPETLLREDEANNANLQAGGKRSVLYTSYRRMVNDTARPAALVCMAGELFGALGQVFDELEDITADHVERVLREFLVGQSVGYVLSQANDADGQPTERYNVNRLFPATQEGIAAILKSAKSGRRRKPLVICWDEEEPPF